MKTVTRLVIIAALCWLLVVLFSQARDHTAGGPEADPTLMVLYFGGVVMVAVIIGSIVAFSFMPAFGDWVGSFFFNPDQQVEKDPHSSAMALIARGDFEGAVEEYRSIFAQNPEDTLALLEASRVYCDKLHNPSAAAEMLETSLQQDWSPENAALICNRLADIYSGPLKDPIRARALLVQVAESMPETKHAANAVHRIHELDRQFGLEG